MGIREKHESVLLEEAVELLDCKPGGTYVDGTIGGGGHAEKILERISPNGMLVGIDIDPHALKIAEERLRKYTAKVRLVHGNFSELQNIIGGMGLEGVDGILLDLGVSMFQLGDALRGFSFNLDGPLDMRMDPGATVTAADLVNKLSERDLKDIIRHYGEEKWAGRIARKVVEERKKAPFRTTGQLAALVERVVPGSADSRRIHPATRTFQALRIAVNEELQALARFLESAMAVLNKGGRLVVISFHSLEDRIVKRTFSYWARSCRCPKDTPVCECEGKPLVKLLTRKPVRPGDAEVAKNPRARSAKMRAVEKL